MLNRRGFLGSAAGAALSGLAPGGAAAEPVAAAPGKPGLGRVPADEISIQLFTLRDQLARDFDGTLRRLAEIGYRRVEHGGFVGRTAADFRAALDRAGLSATSGHVAIPQPFDADIWRAALADARQIGARHIIHPLFGVDARGPIRERARWEAFAHDLNAAGKLASEAGLLFGYHNHNSEFFRLADGTGETGYGVLAAETDPAHVHFEVDLFWAWRGAVDPVDLFATVGPRVLQLHVKDLDQAGSFADPGQGLIDFARIFRAQAVEEYIVERDDAGTPPRAPADALDTARVGYDFLRSVSF